MIQMIHIHILFSFAYVSIVCCTNSISLVTIDQTKLRNWEGYVRASGNALLDQRKVYSADTILPHEQPPQSDVCAGGHSVLATIRTRLNPKHSLLVLQTINPRSCKITEKFPTRAFSLLKVPTSAFTFMTLLRHYDKQRQQLKHSVL